MRVGVCVAGHSWKTFVQMSVTIARKKASVRHSLGGSGGGVLFVFSLYHVMNSFEASFISYFSS